MRSSAVSAGAIVSLLLQIALNSLGFMADSQSAAFGMGAMGIWAFGYILLIPVLVIVGMFFASGILHLCLMIVGGARKIVRNNFSRRLLFIRVDLFVIHDSVLRRNDFRRCGISCLRSSAWRAPTRSRRARPRWRFCCQSSSAAVALMLLGILGGFSALSLLPKN